MRFHWMNEPHRIPAFVGEGQDNGVDDDQGLPRWTLGRPGQALRPFSRHCVCCIRTTQLP